MKLVGRFLSLYYSPNLDYPCHRSFLLSFSESTVIFCIYFLFSIFVVSASDSDAAVAALFYVSAELPYSLKEEASLLVFLFRVPGFS